MRRGPLFTALLLSGLGLLPGAAESQERHGHTVILRDVPVAEALSHVVAVTGIDLLYGSEVAATSADRRVFCRMEQETAEAVLACVVHSAGLDYYRLSSGTYVVIGRPEDAPAFGSLVGIVTDRWTGQPLPFARVRLQDAWTLAESNSAGLFAVGSILPGRHDLVISSPGYRPLHASVEVPSRGEARLVFSLEARPFNARPLVVDGLSPGGISLSTQAGSILDRGELVEAGSSGGDVSRALPQILGVARRPLLSEILIQGGETGTQQLRLDGVPVFNPLSVEGLVGTFSPLALERLTVRKAGFPARFGSAAAGILDFEHATGQREGFGTEVQVDPFNVNGRLSLPIPGGEGLPGGIMLAGRSTLWNLAPVPALERTLREWNQVDPLLTAAHQTSTTEGEAPTRSEAVAYRDRGYSSEIQSSDFHLAARIPTAPGRTFRASFYRGANDLATGVLAAGYHEQATTADRLMLARDSYAWSNLAGRIRYDALLGSRSVGALQIRASRHNFESGFEMYQGWSEAFLLPGVGMPQAEAMLTSRMRELPASTDRTRIREVGGEASLERALGPGHRLHLAAEAVHTSAEVRLTKGPFPALRTDAAHTRLTLAAEDRWSRGGWTVEGGIRTTWLSGADGLLPEPRLALEWDGEAGGLGPATVRLAGGLFRQFVNQMELANTGPSGLVPALRFWLPADGGVVAPRSQHLALEGAVAPAPGWELRGELYGKRTRDLPSVDYAALLQGGWENGAMEPAALVESTRGSAVGAGVRIGRSGEVLRVRAGYDATRSQRTYPSRFDGKSVPDPADAPHRGLLRVETSPRPDLVLRLRGSGVWGRSWAFRRAYYDLLTLGGDRPELGVGKPGDRTLPPLLELDLGATWTGRIGGFGVEFSGDILNVVDRRNVLDYGLQRITDEGDTFQVVPRHLTGITPTLTLRATF